jgi:hypothetical protein
VHDGPFLQTLQIEFGSLENTVVMENIVDNGRASPALYPQLNLLVSVILKTPELLFDGLPE